VSLCGYNSEKSQPLADCWTDEGAHLITWAAAEIATTIMASCIPVLRVLFRDLRDTHPAKISGTPGRRYYQYRKSNSTAETSKGGMVSPVNTTVVASKSNTADITENLPTQTGTEEPKASMKSWGSYWDFSKSRSRVSQILMGKPKSAADPAVRPYPIAENSSQRVLVNIAGEGSGGETGRMEGGIVQTQVFELRYEGTGAQRDVEAGYELRRVGIGQTS